MSEHHATIRWDRGERGFGYQEYSRDHRWTFPNGVTVEASAAPKYLGNENLVDPEEAFVASLSSCHMLTFLAVASIKGFEVESYEDDAVGYLKPNADKKMAITEVVLRPKVTFSGEKRPQPVELDELHHRAHNECFIANSVKTDIRVELAQAVH